MTLGNEENASPLEFRLDPGSGVPTYLQIVRQVEHALRLGYLSPGDRLPKVKDVVASLAINPNTVLKAYRELEHKGLAAGRPGQGTFVEGTLGVVPLPEQQAGRVVALVGPNGAGKTTLLQLAVGLTEPTTGQIVVLGDTTPGSPEALNGIAFVAQDTPLYRYLSVADTLRLVGSLANSWDEAHARHRLGALGIALDRRVGRLSGGQQAQVALAVALARRPRLLILDEPVAELDPLARHDFMSTLMEAVAEDGISVLFSSHVLSELERTCDYLVMLSRGRVQIAGGVEELLATHRVVTGPLAEADAVAAALSVVHEQRGRRQASLLVRTTDDRSIPPGWESDPTNLEDLVLSYLRSPEASALPGPASFTEDPSKAVTA